MKKIIFTILLASAFLYPQSQNILKLENQIKVNPGKLKPSNSLQKTGTFRKKSTGLAILYSLLIPGMGELYANSYSSGKFLLLLTEYFGGFISE